MPDGPVQWYLWLGANIGIAGVMLWVVFAAYQKLVARLADLIEKNTTAMTSLQAVIAALCSKFEEQDKRR